MVRSSKRSNIRSGAPWEARVGYSRAVRVGNFIAVSGTAAVDEHGALVGAGNAYLQAKRCIEIIRLALQQAGGELRHVIRTRIYVTDISLWEEIGRAHQEAFGDVAPATSMVEVRQLIDPGMLVEIEADALLAD